MWIRSLEPEFPDRRNPEDEYVSIAARYKPTCDTGFSSELLRPHFSLRMIKNRHLVIDAIKIIWLPQVLPSYVYRSAPSASCSARSITRISDEPRVAYNPWARLFHILENIPKQFRMDAVTVCTCLNPSVPATGSRLSSCLLRHAISLHILWRSK